MFTLPLKVESCALSGVISGGGALGLWFIYLRAVGACGRFRFLLNSHWLSASIVAYHASRGLT